MSAGEQTGTSPKKTRGRPRGHGKKSLALIEAMYPLVEAAQPITGRGVGYKLFVRKLIASMKVKDMKQVYRLLKEARERASSLGTGLLTKAGSLSGSRVGTIRINSCGP